MIILIILLVLFFVQTTYALIRYGKMTSFHTYLAKTAALLQGVFLIFVFFTDEPILILFYAATIVTMLELTEETILIRLFPQWQENVKGIYWVLKINNKVTSCHPHVSVFRCIFILVNDLPAFSILSEYILLRH